MAGFKRSGTFGIVGVFVVAALVAAIALGTGSGDANPKLTLALIFGVIAIFVVVLFALQRSDLDRAATADARSTSPASAESEEVVDPTALEEAALWKAMAVKPIDPEAVAARGAGWEAGRRSQNLGIVVTALILLTVPAVYLTGSFVPLLVGGPLILIAAVYGSVRALAPGGELDRAYENAGVAMAPLGLEVTERPRVGIEMRDPATPRMGPRIHGDLELSGVRHGRRVTVRLGSGEVRSRSEVHVAAALRPWATGSRGPEIESGPEGITIARQGGSPEDWLCDLWLAERLVSS